MMRPRRRIANRGAGFQRLARWTLLTLFGAAIGLILGDLAADTRLGRAASWNGSYAGLSANPDAAIANALPAPDCADCPDSYGVAARLRAERAERESNAYRELGAVDLDWPVPSAEDEYRYGGRFSDPAAETGKNDNSSMTVVAPDLIPGIEPLTAKPLSATPPSAE